MRARCDGEAAAHCTPPPQPPLAARRCHSLRLNCSAHLLWLHWRPYFVTLRAPALQKFALLCRTLFLTIASCPQQSSHTFYSASACACMHARVNARIITFNMYVKQRCSRSPFNQQLLLLLPPPRPPLQKHRPQDTPRLDAVQSRAWLQCG
jgi:hypothetical protein